MSSKKLIDDNYHLSQHCPICQVPYSVLKIKCEVHVNMCDIGDIEILPLCPDGIECDSKNIFHYRDYSHQLLAEHREKFTKRKYSESNDVCDTDENHKKIRRIIQYENYTDAHGESEDDTFIYKSKFVYKNDISESCRRKSIKKYSSPNTSKCHSESDTINARTKLINKDNEMVCKSTSIQKSKDCEEMGVDNLIDNNHCELEDNLKCFENVIKLSAMKKEKCKTEWNNIFNTCSSPKMKCKANGKIMKNIKPVKPCPHYKKIPNTGFAVDAFQYGYIPGISTYFLTHFHADHYIGLRKKFSKPIYCSSITANLVKKKLRVDEKWLHILPMNESVVINNVEVTSFDANHCPGAIMLLFRLVSGSQFLHVGDFRANMDMECIPQLMNTHINRLYLDTTYFNPKYVFPTQNEVIVRVKSIVLELSMKYPRALFICGTYSIGKEKVFLGILDVLKCKLWAQSPKVDILKCLGNQIISSSLTGNQFEAKIHVLPMNYVQFDRLKKYLLDMNCTFSHIFAFKPTGWEMGRGKINGDWLNKTHNGNVTIFGVPYSEHSNYSELCQFIRFIKADSVIPTVHMGKDREMYTALKSIVDSYKTGPKQQSIQNFITK